MMERHIKSQISMNPLQEQQNKRRFRVWNSGYPTTKMILTKSASQLRRISVLEKFVKKRLMKPCVEHSRLLQIKVSHSTQKAKTIQFSSSKHRA